MDDRVTVITGKPEPSGPPRPNSFWMTAILVVAGIAFGFFLGQDSGSGTAPAEDTADEPPVTAPPVEAPVEELEPSSDDAVEFSGTILASVEFGRGLVTWPGDGDPVKIRLASDVWAAAYDATQSRIAVTLPEYEGESLALHVGTLGDLRFVTSGVTGFAWHPTDPGAIAWVEESGDGYALVTAEIASGLETATQIAAFTDRVRPAAWGDWGFALDGDDGLTTVAPSGEIIANADLQFLAAGSDGRMVVARPAGTPLSSDWAITGPDLADEQSLERFGDLDEHPTAAAILPQSGRIVLVSNRFSDDDGLARIEILSPDGSRQTLIRSGMIAESVAWSPDEERLAIGGYYYGPRQVRSIVLLADADGSGDPIEVPFDHQVRPLGIQN